MRMRALFIDSASGAAAQLLRKRASASLAPGSLSLSLLRSRPASACFGSHAGGISASQSISLYPFASCSLEEDGRRSPRL